MTFTESASAGLWGSKFDCCATKHGNVRHGGSIVQLALRRAHTTGTPMIAQKFRGSCMAQNTPNYQNAKVTRLEKAILKGLKQAKLCPVTTPVEARKGAHRPVV